MASMRIFNPMRKVHGILACLLFAAGCSANPLPGSNSVGAEPSLPLATVSFDLYHNRVYLPVEVNHQLTISMVLDTGAADSGLSSSTAQSLQLKTSGEAQLTGNGESNQKIALVRNIEFSVGGAPLLEKTVIIVPFQDLEAREGRSIAGVLGVALFRKYVVVIDYQNKKLSLFDPRHFVYRGTGTIVPLKIKGEALFQGDILLQNGQSVQAQLAIDSGTYSALRLYRGFLQKHQPLQDSQAPTVLSYGFGIGGEFPERLARVGDLGIGSLRLHAPLARLSEANSGATVSSSYDGTIGGAILCRFKVTLDYSRSEMILEPNSSFPDPFKADTSGLILSASGADFRTISIRHVISGTPAALAGVKEGDILLSVNGTDASSLGLERTRLLFQKPGSYHLELQRGSNKFAVDMVTRDLVP